MTFPRLGLACTAALAALLTACGGGSTTSSIETPSAPTQTRIDLLASSVRGIESIAFRGNTAYVSLSNSQLDGTSVMKSTLPLQASSTWTDVALGSCALGTATEFTPTRAPRLKVLGSSVWLFQQWSDENSATKTEHSLCVLETGSTAFTPRDHGLQACAGGYCSTLWMTDLKQVGNRLFTNAGAGLNVFVSDDQGTSWRVLLGQFDSMICTHSAFNVVGDRVLVGGECPLDDAFLRAYPLTPDVKLRSPTPVPLVLPVLENRNVQFIEPVPNSMRVFAGVEGGLLRSDDGGHTFKFVIQQPLSGTQNYPYIRSFLSLSSKPTTLVVGGFDKAAAKPYLAWSADSGDHWTDISSLLPGYSSVNGTPTLAEVTSVTEDPQGRIIVTVNEEANAKGRLLLLTLGQP